MIPFLAAQATSPFDPAPMLIQADWLEEHGDLAGATALRGLAAAGYASLVGLALGAGNWVDTPFLPDGHFSAPEHGDGRFGDRFSLIEEGEGVGDGDHFEANCSHGGLGSGGGEGWIPWHGLGDEEHRDKDSQE